MKNASHPLILLAGLLVLLAVAAQQALTQAAPATWPTSLHADLMAIGALALAAIAAILLWRQYRLSQTLATLQAQLASERSLRAGAEQALIETNANLCRLALQQEQVQHNERQRIARDIHDDLGQHLLSLTIDICALQTDATLPGELRRHLRQIEQHVRLTIASLRDIIQNLRPASLDAGLRLAIERQLADFKRLSGIACELLADDTVFAAAPDAQRDGVLYRVLQEALANIVRHAQASAVKVTLHRQPGCLSMSVSDNGVGLPAGSARPGCGLLGIEERVRQAGGRFHVASQPGVGTVLTMSLPSGEASTS